MITQNLLRQISMHEFYDAFFLKVAYSEPGGAVKFTTCGSWSKLCSLFAQPQSDLICGRSDGSQLDPEQGRRLGPEAILAEGYTIGFRHAEKFDPELKELAREFEQEFQADIDIHLYCTPANQAGFGWHYDAEDVFVLQTEGTKEWSLRKNSVNPWPLLETMPDDMRYEREIMPLYRCQLAAGDWLYIPHGYWHRTHSQERSISLSIGINSPSGLDLFDHLRQHLLQSLLWRQRLPPQGSSVDEEHLKIFQEHCVVLGKDLQKMMSSAEFAKSYQKMKAVPKSVPPLQE